MRKQIRAAITTVYLAAVCGAATLATADSLSATPRPTAQAAVPFCERESWRSYYVESPEGHLVELEGRVFRTCNKAAQRGFLLSANPEALPALRFPYTLLTLHVASPYSTAVPSGEWGAFVQYVMMLMKEGGRIERRPDRLIGEVVYREYLKFDFIPDGTLIPASVYFIPTLGSDVPDHFVECRGPVVGLHGDASHCSMWLRYKGLNANIWFSHTKHAFPDPIPIEQFDAYARDVYYILSATDVTEILDDYSHLNYTLLEGGKIGGETTNEDAPLHSSRSLA